MIDAVVLYNSSDRRFIDVCVRNLYEAGIRVSLITYTHLWNGTPEDLDAVRDDVVRNLQYLKSAHIVQWTPGHSPWHWEAYGRYYAVDRLGPDSTHTMFIDVDEIVEPDALRTFVENTDLQKYESFRLKNYWYFRDPTFRANAIEDSVVVCRTDVVKRIGWTPRGREQYPTSRISLPNGQPFIHHFSWVRTQKEMLNKVSNWGHAGEKNWVELVNEEFSRPFNGKDFIHGYTYQTVPNTFNIKMGDV
jgi:hypothetical protein